MNHTQWGAWGPHTSRQKAFDRQIALTGIVVKAQHRAARRDFGQLLRNRGQRGAGFIPTNLHTSLLDGAIQVEGDAAKDYARRSAAEEGLLVGISSGATLAAIAQKLPEIPAGSTVLGFNYDTGERYLSVEGFLP